MKTEIRKVLAGSLIAALFLSTGFAHGYGSSRKASGGGGGSSSSNSCQDFGDVSPDKNEKVGMLSDIFFSAPSGYEAESVIVEINNEPIPVEVKERSNGDLLVNAKLDSPITSAGAVKISLYARDKSRCEKNAIYFVEVDPEKGDSYGSGGSEDNGEEKKDEEKEKVTEEKKEEAKFEFSDTKSHWSQKYVESIAERGIVNGYGDGSFGPDNAINRAEMVKIAINANGQGTSGAHVAPFEDVPADYWAAPYIQKAKELGIIYGYFGNKIFEPSGLSTRAMALKLLIASAGIDVSGYNGQSPFPDISANTWYAPYIAWAKAKGIVNGYENGNFGPNNPVTRGEVSKMTVAFLNYLGK